MHHAQVIAGESEAGISTALATIEESLGMKVKANPDVIVLRYGLLTVEDARKIISIAQQGSIGGEHKAIVVAVSRIYHEAQNALLKLFEEPPQGTYLFLVLPTVDLLLPTLRSRVVVLPLSLSTDGRPKIGTSELVEDFLKAGKERRSTIIKRLVSSNDEDERRAARDEALALVQGIEEVAYTKWRGDPRLTALLSDISILRGYLHDRSAPLKMILEHISLILPRGLGKQ